MTRAVSLPSRAVWKRLGGSGRLWLVFFSRNSCTVGPQGCTVDALMKLDSAIAKDEKTIEALADAL